jgi:hypothetical protein
VRLLAYAASHRDLLLVYRPSQATTKAVCGHPKQEEKKKNEPRPLVALCAIFSFPVFLLVSRPSAALSTVWVLGRELVLEALVSAPGFLTRLAPTYQRRFVIVDRATVFTVA